MNIGIIGAGNMGGAIARAIAASFNGLLAVCSPNRHGELDELKRNFPAIATSTLNRRAVEVGKYIIIAVKPWQLDDVLREIAPYIDEEHHVIVSVVANATIAHIKEVAGGDVKVVRVMPNTAISVGAGMTFVSSSAADEFYAGEVQKLFASMGASMIIPEGQMPAATALASCGIAYAMRYVRAAMEGGVELGFKPADAQAIVAATVKGAATILQNADTHPETEIDRVTTPSGITIRGLNAMEEHGFTASVIAGLKASI